jgi:prophage regulatory protein
MEKELLNAIADLQEMREQVSLNKTIFTPEEAARYLGMALSYLYKLTSAGILPFSKPNGKRIYFSRIELDEWAMSRKSKSGQQKEIEASTYLSSRNNFSKVFKK